MSNRFKITIYTLLFILLIFPLSAQQTLSLEQCRQMALQKNEDLQIAKKSISIAEAEKKAAWTNFLPSVSATATGLYLNEDFETDLVLPTSTPDMATGELTPNVMLNPQTGQPVVGADGNPIFNMYAFLPVELSVKGAYMAGLNLEQPIYTGGKILAGNKMASIGTEMAGLNKEMVTMNVLSEAEQAYWLHISVKEKYKLALKAVDLLSGLKERVENSYEAGMVQKNELLKVQVQYNKAVLDVQKAKSGLELTRMSLCRVVGLPLDTKIVAVDSVIGAESIAKPDSFNIADRPEFQLMEKSIAMEEQKIKIARADYLPTVGVRAGYSLLGGVEFSGQDISNSNLMAIASVSVPIFHWGQGYRKIASAKYSRDIKQLELDKNTELLQLQVEQARLNYNDAQLRIDLTKSALEQSDENLRVSSDNYELGMLTMTDLLIAQVEWQKAYSDLIEAKTDCKLKEAAYLQALGILGK